MTNREEHFEAMLMAKMATFILHTSKKSAIAPRGTNPGQAFGAFSESSWLLLSSAIVP